MTMANFFDFQFLQIFDISMAYNKNIYIIMYCYIHPNHQLYL